MSTQISRSALVKGRLILSIDDGRPAGDAFKFPAAFRKELADDVAALDTADQAVASARGANATASPRLRAAKDELGRLLREGYRALEGVPSYELDAETKAGVFEEYGWRGGEIGELNDERVLELADTALDLTTEEPAPAWKYPARLVELIDAQLDIVEAEESAGASPGSIDVRNLRLAKLLRTLLRARFYYCFATDAADRTPELTRIGHQPRRLPPARRKPAAPEGPKA